MPRRRNTTFMPVSSRARETKPSADICSANPKCVVRKWADAATSSTFSDTAEAVIFTGTPELDEDNSKQAPEQNSVHRTEYNVQQWGGVPNSAYRSRRSGPYPAAAVA